MPETHKDVIDGVCKILAALNGGEPVVLAASAPAADPSHTSALADLIDKARMALRVGRDDEPLNNRQRKLLKAAIKGVKNLYPEGTFAGNSTQHE